MLTPLSGILSPLARRRKAAPAGPTLTYTTGLQLWLEADRIAGLADGDPVATWPDVSGTGHDGTQSEPLRYPVYRANIVNGLPAIRFDPSPIIGTYIQRFEFPDFLSVLPAASVFCVLRKDSQVDGTHWHHWGADAPDNHYAYPDNTIYDGMGATARQTAGTPIVALTSWHLYGVTVGGGSWTLRLNGSIQHAAGGVTVGWTTTPGIGTAFAGSVQSYIAAVLVYDHALADADRVAVEGYLMSKY